MALPFNNFEFNIILSWKKYNKCLIFWLINFTVICNYDCPNESKSKCIENLFFKIQKIN